jgi:hypothetical protein
MSAIDSAANPPTPQTETGRWPDAQRLEGWAGEVRVNLIRLLALVAFYGYHLLNVYVIREDPTLQGLYHAQVTAVVVAWCLVVVVLYFCLARRWVPPGLKYAAVLADLCLITALLIVPGNGPKSPLVVLYFLVIVSAGLRLSLPLVYTATLGSVAAYLIVLGTYVFGQIGAVRYYAADSIYRVPRTQEVICLLALGGAGLLTGQLVRQARRLVEGSPVQVVGPGED